MCIYTASVHRVNRFNMMHLMTRWRQGLCCEFHIKCLNAQMPLLCQWKYELPTNSNMEVGQRSLIAFPFMHYSTPVGFVDLKLQVQVKNLDGIKWCIAKSTRSLSFFFNNDFAIQQMHVMTSLTWWVESGFLGVSPLHWGHRFQGAPSSSRLLFQRACTDGERD